VAAVNASPQRMRAEILSYPVTIFERRRLTIGYGDPACGGVHIYSIGSLIRTHSGRGTLDDLVCPPAVPSMRACTCCGRAGNGAGASNTGPDEPTISAREGTHGTGSELVVSGSCSLRPVAAALGANTCFPARLRRATRGPPQGAAPGAKICAANPVGMGDCAGTRREGFPAHAGGLPARACGIRARHDLILRP
jgi:hypothetical protein